MRSLTVILMSGLLVGAAAQAAPLCRDTKGLFTPCPPSVVRAHAEAQVKKERAREADQAPVVMADGTTRPPRVRKPSRPIVEPTHLCHDSKGLFTPCPR